MPTVLNIADVLVEHFGDDVIVQNSDLPSTSENFDKLYDGICYRLNVAKLTVVSQEKITIFREL